MRRISLAIVVLQVLTVWLILQTVVRVLLGFVDYFPPNLRADFLLGREGYFFDGYHWAFYAHILSGPVTLVLGLLLLSQRFRRRYARWHRQLGRVQVALVLLVLTPSGLWMSAYALSGPVAGAGFAALSVATAASAVLGWRAAIRRQFEQHQWWMLRCYALLCSAIVLRLIGGASVQLELDWTYPIASWVSWLLPLAVLEILRCWSLVSNTAHSSRNHDGATATTSH